MLMDTKAAAAILADIHQPSSLERQIDALRILKHDVIGNEHRKEAWKRSGVLTLLAKILASPSLSSTTWRGDEGKAVLHAVTIVGSLAYGGSDCVDAMETSQIFGGLIRALEAVTVNMAIVLAALRALNNIANAFALHTDYPDNQALAVAIYSEQGQRNLRKVILHNLGDTFDSRQTMLAARLLSKTCITDERREQVIASGLLEALASVTATYASRAHDHQPNTMDCSLGFVLRALATILDSSSERADQFEELHLEQLSPRSFHHINGNGSLASTQLQRDHGNHEERKSQLNCRLLSWLLRLVKKTTGSTRLMALWMVSLYASHRHPEVDDRVAMSLIPLLVEMLDQLPQSPQLPDLYPEDIHLIPGDTCKVLAALLRDDRSLQEAAFEAGAIERLTRLLRQANEAVRKDRSKTFWRAERITTTTSKADTCLPQALCDQWKFREAVLQALAAITAQNDDYRKAVVDSGAVPILVESLKPFDGQALSEQQRDMTGGDTLRSVGNPVPVLLAACEAAKALSRSVSTLRTSLVDANLAAPLVVLLDHSNLDVQIAATAVLCNVVLEFSQMRQAAVDAGALRLLCDHAHSKDARLKLNSLWALKHVVHSAPNALKVQCVNGLGPGWLKQALQQSTSRSSPPIMSGLSSLQERQGSVSYKGMRDSELDMMDNDVKPWIADDLAIREQALDFVRNLIAGKGCEEMADLILREVGQDKLFDMLGNLLQPPDGDDVTLAVLAIISNFASDAPRHRQMLVSQNRLLKLILPFFQHPRVEIRSACVWLTINLTWPEDNEDRLNCKARAYELRKLGLVEKLDALIDDSDLDIRERTKTALHSMSELLR